MSSMRKRACVKVTGFGLLDATVRIVWAVLLVGDLSAGN